MATVSVTITADLASELNAIAVEAGFPNAKAMTIAYLKATVQASRTNKAVKDARRAAEVDVVGIS